VENALVSYGKEQAARRTLAQSVESNRRSVEISNELYAKGLVDFLNVLVSQRALYQSEDALAQSDQRVLTNLAALFKALGGGWEIGSMQDQQKSETGQRG
jgi:outer membrane protein TolC